MEGEQPVDIWKQTMQNFVDTLKEEQEKMKEEIADLKATQKLQDQKIQNVQDTLKEIKDDTKWLRRAMTNALIVAVIGGAVAIFFAAISH